MLGTMSSYYQSTIIDGINNEDFICEIENHPAVWDPNHEGYSNKMVKKKAWESIIRKLVPDYDDKSLLEKNALYNTYQKRWHNIRSCYAREIKTKKEEMRGGVKKKKSPYIYNDILRFLDSIIKNRDHPVIEVDEEHWVDVGDMKFDPLINEDLTQFPSEFVSATMLSDNQSCNTQENTTISTTSGPSSIAVKQTDLMIDQYYSLKRKRKDKETEEDELLQLLKKRVLDQEQRIEVESTDEDRMFLLSLVSELRKVPDAVKLRVKSDIMMAIVNGQNYLSSGLRGHPLLNQSQNNLFSYAQNSASNISANNLNGPSSFAQHNNKQCPSENAATHVRRKVMKTRAASQREDEASNESDELED